MMRILLLLILLVYPTLAAVVLNENLYERDNRVDLMLSFDTPFEGKIRKRTDGEGAVTILLEGAEVPKPFFRSLRNGFVESVAVTKSGSRSALVKIVPADGEVGVQASRTVDGFGLRLRITPKRHETRKDDAPPLPAILKEEARKARSSSRTKSAAPTPLNRFKEEEPLPGWRYWLVMGGLLLLLGALWLVRRKGGGGASRVGNWLMPSRRSGEAVVSEAIIRYQKPLDRQNRLLLLEFGGKQYLMVVGNTNLLLDTFAEGEVREEEDFARMFEANKKQLDHFLKENHPDAYEAFKANASKEEHL